MATHGGEAPCPQCGTWNREGICSCWVVGPWWTRKLEREGGATVNAQTLGTERDHLNPEYIKACVNVAAIARHFVATTDAEPLHLLSFEQGYIWDELTAALAVVEELEQ